MDYLLICAALLTFGIGLAHSWLGEKYLIRRLLRRKNLPVILGSEHFTKQTLRFAWHATTLAWAGLGVVLLFLAGTFSMVSLTRGLLLTISITFGITAILPIVFSRGRHLSWIVFVAIALLTAYAAF